MQTTTHLIEISTIDSNQYNNIAVGIFGSDLQLTEHFVNSFLLDGEIKQDKAITVKRYGERFELIDGKRRVNAILLVGGTQVWAEIIEEQQEIDFFDSILRLNLYREKPRSAIYNEVFVLLEPSERGARNDLSNIETVGRYQKAIKKADSKLSKDSLWKYGKVKEIDKKYPDAGIIRRYDNSEIKTINELVKFSEAVEIDKTYPDKKLLEKFDSYNKTDDVDNDDNKKIRLSVNDFHKLALKTKARVVVQQNRKGTSDIKLVTDFLHKDNYLLILNDSRQFSEYLKTPNNPRLQYHCVVTSPPYYNMRTYDKADSNEIGKEATPEDYINNLYQVFKPTVENLPSNGSIWVNLKEPHDKTRNLKVCEDFVNMMVDKLKLHRVSTFIWYKSNGLMIGDEDKTFRSQWEYLYWFVKDPDNYYFNNPKVYPINKKIKLQIVGGRRNPDGSTTNRTLDVSRPYQTFSTFIDNNDFLGTIQSYSAAKESQIIKELYGDHAAIYPLTTPFLPIVSTTNTTDFNVVYDPFMGSGSTLISSLLLGRKAMGMEKLAKYYTISANRVADIINAVNLEDAEQIEYYFKRKINAQVYNNVVQNIQHLSSNELDKLRKLLDNSIEKKNAA